jgi:hypothetical protein
VDPALDGGRAALEAIRNQGALELYPDETGKPKRLSSLVDSFLKDFQAIHNAKALRSKDSGISIMNIRARLRGWEFVSLAQRRPTVQEKELREVGEGCSWWEIGSSPQVLVMFGRGCGQVIRPAPGVKVPIDWKTVPENSELLVASYYCIRDLRDESGHSTRCQDPCNLLHLTSTVVWYQSTKECSLDICLGSCSEVQEVKKLGLVDQMGMAIHLIPRTQERIVRVVEGKAFIFGDRKRFHQTLTQLSKDGSQVRRI